MAAGFHNEPRIYPVAGNMFEIREPLVYYWSISEISQRLTIFASEEKPYRWDGASIPVLGTLITKVLPSFETIYPMGIHIYASGYHDYMWMYQGRVPVGAHEKFVDGAWVDAEKVWTFTETNRLFGRMLKEDGIGKKERTAMQLAVQSPIGWFNWKRGTIPDDARPLPTAA